MRKLLLIILALYSINLYSQEINRWDIFVEALIYEESRGKHTVQGKTNDVGILQITPIYVKECNRILKEQRYTLSDRYCPIKSLEMFEIIQSHHNPQRDIDRAIKLHNPKASKYYKQRILNKMNELLIDYDKTRL